MKWPMVKLGEVAIVNPRLPKETELLQPVSFVAMASASEDGYLLSEDIKVLEETRKGFTYFNRADVLLAKITPCFENGKCLRPNQIRHEIGFGSTEFHVLRPDLQRLDAQYLFYMVWSNRFRSLGESSMSGAAGQKRVSADFLRSFEIPLPPLEEQKRIAAILDKADAIRRKRQQAIKLADDFLRAVFLDMFGDIPAKKSKYQFLGCRGYVSVSSGKSSRDVFSEMPTEIPIYGGNGVNGYATRSLYDEPVIVLGRVGQQCAITNLTSGPAWVTDNAIVVQVTDSSRYNPVYLAYAFMCSPIRDTVTRLDLPFINQSMILDAPIPLPPIELQNKFEKIREKTFQLIRGLTESAGKAQSSFSALSQKAFSGEL